MNWQGIVSDVVKEAMTAKWRDYALTRLPEVSGWKLQKPKAFGQGNEAIYSGTTKSGVPLRVTVDKANGVWVAEAGGLREQDEITSLDQKSVEFALSEASEAMDGHIQERQGKRAARDFTDVDVRRLSGSLRDIKSRSEDVLEKLDDLQLDEDGQYITLAEARNTDLDDGTSISYQLEMIEQSTGAFRHM